MTIPAGTPDVVQRATALAPRIASFAAKNEAARRLDPELVADLADAGLFRVAVPREIGGLEHDAATMVRVIEAVSTADGAAGWCVMIGASTGVNAGYLAKEAAREVYGASPNVVNGGVFMPMGRAVRVPGGYRVTGRWPFASGSQHCSWLLGGAVVFGEDGPEKLPDGTPNIRLMYFPVAQVEIIDTWDSSGLRGTGSHDMAVNDVFVPEDYSISRAGDKPWPSGALYKFPVFGLLGLGVASVALGIARASLESLKELAGAKTPTGSRRPLAERGSTQEQVARAEAELRGARAFMFEAIGDAWTSAERGAAITVEQRALLRLAATHATVASTRVVDAMYTLGGATSAYSSSPLQRQFRDIHVATQHIMVAAPTFELTGRVLLGVPVDTSAL